VAAARRTRAAVAKAAAALRPWRAHELVELSGDATETLRGAEWLWRHPGAERPTIIALDIGKNTGAAILSRDYVEFSSYSQERRGLRREWCDFVAAVIDSGLEHAERRLGKPLALLVVEDAFVKDDVASAMELARLQGAAMAFADTAGIPAVRVMPSSWQSAMLGSLKREQGKAASLIRARAEFGIQIGNEHVADAALMGKWAFGYGR
jgi:hypothetical protein